MCEHMRFSTMFDHVFQPWDLRTVFVALILIETGPFFSFLFLPRPTMTPNDPLKCTWLNLISALDGSNPVKRSPDFSSCTKYPNPIQHLSKKKRLVRIIINHFFQINHYPSLSIHKPPWNHQFMWNLSVTPHQRDRIHHDQFFQQEGLRVLNDRHLASLMRKWLTQISQMFWWYFRDDLEECINDMNDMNRNISNILSMYIYIYICIRIHIIYLCHYLMIFHAYS